MPDLDASLTDRHVWQELGAGVERLHLLLEGLTVLEGELAMAGSDALGPASVGVRQGRFSPARAALLARLASADPEAACDADALLTLGPA
jgi:hypothetical protein